MAHSHKHSFEAEMIPKCGRVFRRSSTLPIIQDAKLIDQQPKAHYSRLKSSAIRITPPNYHCRLFCGGVKCRYCDASQWSKDEQAIPGLLSTWITEDLIASSRPIASIMKQNKTIHQLKKKGVGTVVNLQKSGEHSKCGDGLLNCGFSYDPELFMAKDIYCYNFGWPDYGTTSIPLLLDMVKVINFAMKQSKVLIHCHAGYGRTGVLIAVYFIWHYGWTPSSAVDFIRNKRPNCIQTEEQLQSLYEFSAYLQEFLRVFPRFYTNYADYLAQQQLVLHGVEAKLFSTIPKIIYVCCEYLLERAGVLPLGSVVRSLDLLSKYTGKDNISDTLIPFCSTAFQKTWSRNVVQYSSSQPLLPPLNQGLQFRNLQLDSKLTPRKSDDDTNLKFIQNPVNYSDIFDEYLDTASNLPPKWGKNNVFQEEIFHRLHDWSSFVDNLNELKCLSVIDQILRVLQITVPHVQRPQSNTLPTVRYITSVFGLILLKSYTPKLEKQIAEILNRWFPSNY